MIKAKLLRVPIISVALALSFFGDSYCQEEPSYVEAGAVWDFDDGTYQGWLLAHSVEEYKVSDGILSFNVSASGPFIAISKSSIDADRFGHILIRMRINAGITASLVWVQMVGGSSPDNRVEFMPESDGLFHTYEISMYQNPGWSGMIGWMRFSPNEGESTEVEIDYIKAVRVGKRVSVASIETENKMEVANEPFYTTVLIENSGGVDLDSVTVELSLPESMRLMEGDSIYIVYDLPPRQMREVRWRLLGKGSGLYPVTVSAYGPDIDVSRLEVYMPVTKPSPELSPEVPNSPRAYQINSGDIVLENQDMRMVFMKEEWGVTGCDIYASCDGLWVKTCTMYPLGKLLYKSSSGKTSTDLIPRNTEVSDSEPYVKFNWSFADNDGVNWGVDLSFGFQEGSRVVSASYTLSPSEEREIYLFEGPVIRAGDGSFGSGKDEALFPGLEWLVQGEVSSDTLDASPPHNLRVTPKPIKITIPLMAVRNERVVAGIMWNPLYEWADGEDMISAKFASPNWVEKEDNHLMGLLVPSVPKWVKENELEAKSPYLLEAGKEVRISAKVFSIRGSSVLDAVTLWADEHGGFPEPKPWPRSLDEEMALCRTAYLSTLWEPEAKGWPHCVDWDPAPYKANISMLWIDSMMSDDPEVRSTDREVAGIVLDVLKRQGPGGLVGFDVHIPQGQLPYLAGDLDSAFGALCDYANGLIASQSSDGSWPYNGKPELGRIGDVNVGTCAHNADITLKVGRMTGNRNAIEAGLKALGHMDRYIIPRGAQTWEVPLHTPDVFACAKAMSAYIEGYIITGEKGYLEKTVYWALAGIPFLYMWELPDLPVMEYSSIPVFGATGYTWPWFGLPVQWNGLAYAHELYRLAQFDDSFPWERIARGVNTSGIWQQYADPAERNYGTYPDSWRLETNQANGPDINPETIWKNIFYELGWDPDVQTRIFLGGSGTVHLSSGARIEGISIADPGPSATVDFNLRYFEGEPSYSSICPVEKPSGISCSGRGLPFLSSLSEAEEGWTYLGDREAVIIKVNHVEDTGRISVEGLSVEATGVKTGKAELFGGFSLVQNYPNPFNSETVIPFSLGAAGSGRGATADVRLTIYNSAGQKVRDLFSGALDNGIYGFYWDAKDNSGKEAASGIYFVRLSVLPDMWEGIRKMVLVR